MDQATYEAKLDAAFMNVYHSVKKNAFSRWLATVKFYLVVMEQHPKVNNRDDIKELVLSTAVRAARRQILKVAAECSNPPDQEPTVKVITDLVDLPA